ncbi:hypothetical protein CRM22_007915 [Opisthorchis felineus]|uniref:Peptidase A2 domain-containing protein n=1 Tax=Opisthorchis felineus TaxID=147828 RepID=A0A4S2LDQ3_OPIFE|nr:hypothetical protein CRM22_007915 [Opisthorchis felineus]
MCPEFNWPYHHQGRFALVPTLRCGHSIIVTSGATWTVYPVPSRWLRRKARHPFRPSTIFTAGHLDPLVLPVGQTTVEWCLPGTFFNRNERPGKSADECAGALRDLAARAYPEELQNIRDAHAAHRFMASVRNVELRAKFRQKENRTLYEAVQLARNYEHLYNCDNPARSPVPSFPTAQCQWQVPRTPIGYNANSRNCFYCARFGKNARRCGHNSPNGGSQLSATTPTESARQVSPLLITGQLNSKHVSILVNTGASPSFASRQLLGTLDGRCSVIPSLGSTCFADLVALSLSAGESTGT